ncbi:LysR family transcriptional regulator [Rhizobium daejeonense]|uniref:HTH-type transcriptional regulator TtuA n=1 Tax=Rhizobium daejeonense TaxID=240521 RepID=A0A6M1RWX6_9HYPH|nr:LysR family transcriptional regulator [Rhizobium daejeonense]NGO63283.1 LysR family transcriptional regulator [Rhizobium daejeonense]
MDRLDRMQLFIRVVERRSFSAAASDLGLSRSTATEAIKQLETDLGVRLLERTTRHVTTTLDGSAYYERCVGILAEVEEADNAFRDARPRGLLRIDAHPLLTRTFLLPHLPDFLARYPELDLHIGQGDRLVDLVREGVDCAIRAGALPDSGMIARRLTFLSEITCASPDYIARYGMPPSPRDLEGHVSVGFVSSRTGEAMPLEFMVGGASQLVPLPSRITVNDSDTMADLARLGFGLIQAPRYRLEPDLKKGTLVEVLPDFPPSPTPLSALYPQNRHTSARVRVFLDWLSEIFATALI